MIRPPGDLLERWLERAKSLERYAPEVATAIRDCADDLKAAILDAEMEALTLQQGAEESGYSESSLQRMVAEGKIKNVGKKGAPRIQRRDLPRKVTPPAVPTDGKRTLIDDTLDRRAAK